MAQQCSIVGCNKPIVVKEKGDEYLQCCEEHIEEVRQYFKDKVFNTVIPRNIKLAEAPSFGKPISHYDKECIGAKAYGSVTGELLKEKIDYEQIKGS